MLGHKQLLKAYNEYQVNINLPVTTANLYEPVNYILSLGGKRLRPVLTLLTYQLGKKVDQKALKAAYAIEMFHNFSLVHDDIMDHALLRRGNQTVHVKWDEATGILSGDQMLILAFRAIREAGNDLEVIERFEQMCTNVCEGQRMDMDFEREDFVAEEEYLGMIRKKTAVLIGFALWCGGKLGGLPSTICEQLYEYGCEIGLGFQIMDDLLDCYGGEEFGKRIGGDILEGKKTLLYLRCLSAATVDDRIIIHSLINGEQSDEEKISGVLALFNKYHIKESVDAEMQSYFEKADHIGTNLTGANEVDSEAVHRLLEYVNVIRERVI